MADMLVLRPFQGNGAWRIPGDIVDTSGWTTERALVDQRYLQPMVLIVPATDDDDAPKPVRRKAQ